MGDEVENSSVERWAVACEEVQSHLAYTNLEKGYMY